MSGAGNGSGSQTNVDISELDRLAGEIRTFVNADARSEAQATRYSFSSGVPFGQSSASGYVYGAKARYRQNLVRIIDTLQAYVEEAESLAENARLAAANYRCADLSAAARVTGTGIPTGFIGPVAPVWATGPTAPQPQPTVPPSFIGPTGFIGPPSPSAAGSGGIGTATATVSFEPVAEWCTNWDAYDARALWEMFEPDDIEEGWSHESAWRRVATALDSQVRQLKRQRDAIAAAWPPEHGSASVTLLQRFDELIASMTGTGQAAASTQSAIREINTAISAAKQDLRSLNNQYDRKSNDLIPSFFDNAEDEINEEARTRAAKAEREVRDAAAPMRPIPMFVASRVPIDGFVDDDQPTGSGGPGTPTRQPASSIVPPVRHTPPAPLPNVAPELPAGTEWTPGAGAGPQLSGLPGGTTVSPGTTSPPPPASGGTLSPGISAPGISAPAGSGPAGFPGMSANWIGSGTAPLGGSLGNTGARTVSTSPIAGRAMPVGGVIGGTPTIGAGTGRPMAPGAVIGASPTGGRSGAAAPGTAGAAPTGRGATGRSQSGMAAATPMGAPPAGGRRSGGRQTRPGGDPDNPWRVAQGVAPIIEASTDDYRHDPGPGVIGMDR